MANNGNELVLTTEGKAKLEEELHYLETEKRDEVGERIRIAREFGDISENSEYDDAKNRRLSSSASQRSTRSWPTRRSSSLPSAATRPSSVPR